MSKWKFAEFGTSVLTFFIGAASVAEAEVAGAIGAVNTHAQGTPPGGAGHALSVGDSVVQNESVQTDASGTAHIMFKDRSALNVGRNSKVVIDKFVYNPNMSSGQQSVSLTRGALRFVGGQISHSSETTVKTTAAQIGVRGGNVTVVMEASGHVVVMVHNGIAIVSNEFGGLTLHTGFQLIVVPGAPLGEPTKISLVYLREATRRLASVGNQTGGANRLPTNADAAHNDIGSHLAPTISPNVDLPTAGDNLIRGKTTTQTKPILPYRP
jgi:hypothetical protein